MVTSRLFLLSPANCGGSRARQLLSPRATFALAERLRSPEGAPLGEVFAFMSGLYFRGKLAYARRFARSCRGPGSTADSGVHVITATAGLMSADTSITSAALLEFAGQEIAADNRRFAEPLARSVRALVGPLEPCEVVLLGSIASPKYVDVLLDVLGDQLYFPLAFVGRGDMSRGGLLLRHASAGVELEYGPVKGAVVHGARPPRLPPLPGPRATSR